MRCKFCGLAGDRVALLKRECPDLLRVALDAALDRERDVRADLRDLRKRITRLEALRREANATPKPPC